MNKLYEKFFNSKEEYKQKREELKEQIKNDDNFKGRIAEIEQLKKEENLLKSKPDKEDSDYKKIYEIHKDRIEKNVVLLSDIEVEIKKRIVKENKKQDIFIKNIVSTKKYSSFEELCTIYNLNIDMAKNAYYYLLNKYNTMNVKMLLLCYKYLEKSL